MRTLIPILGILLAFVFWQQNQSTAPVEKEIQGPSPDPTYHQGFERLDGAIFVESKRNDGDSFTVRHGGREFQLRLYFVDTPETYLSDRHPSQRKRVEHQSRYFKTSKNDIIAIGKQASHYTKGILGKGPFTVFTKWEQVYDGDRYYGFLKLASENTYLSENLVANGLARIYTKGVDTPDGRTRQSYTRHLHQLEKSARQRQNGAWAFTETKLDL